jgi:uncharacterized membrane protein YgcG
VIPVYLSFVETLQNVLQKLFDNVLSPVITSVFNFLLQCVTSMFSEIFADILLDGYIILLKLVNFMQTIFGFYSGSKVVYQVSGKTSTQTTLLEYLFGLSGISKALIWMTVLGAVLAFIFAIYQTGKSMSDSVLNDDFKPISKVLENGFKSAVTFMIVPFMCVFLLQLSNIMLDQVLDVFKVSSGAYDTKTGTYTSETSVDDIIFNTTAEAAAKSSSTFKDNYKNKHAAYSNRSQVKKDFTLGNIDYWVGYISCLLLILILLVASISFIRRCFDLLILYLVSPFFSATIALDGGTRFNKWRNQFVGKFFSAFGSVFAMRLYLMMIPFYQGHIQYSKDSSLNSFISILMILAGAWSVYKGQTLISQPLLGQADNESMGAGLGLIVGAGRLAGGAARGAAGGARNAYRNASAGKGGKGGKGGSGGSSSSSGSGSTAASGSGMSR